jgi:hypothetical protein
MIVAIRSAPHLLAPPGSLRLNLTRVLATFVVAAASWLVIEQPIRRGRVRFVGSAPRFAAAGAVTTALVATIVLWATAHEPTLDVPLEIAGCPTVADEACLRRRGSEGRPVVALMGDSLARSLDSAFLKLAAEHDWTYVLAARNGCRLSHLLTVYEGRTRPNDRVCYEAMPHLVARLLATWKPTAVVAVDRWEIIDFVGASGATLATRTPEHVAETEAALADVSRAITSSRARLAFIELPPILPGECLKKDKGRGLQCQRCDADPLQRSA